MKDFLVLMRLLVKLPAWRLVFLVVAAVVGIFISKLPEILLMV